MGLLVTLTINTVIMGIGLYLVLMFNQWRWDLNIWDINPYLWKAVVLMFLEFMVMTAIAIMFSSFTSSSTLSAILTLSVFVIGHLTEELKSLGKASQDLVLQKLTAGIYYVLPNLDYFNVKGRVVHLLEVPPVYMISVIGYGLLYSAMILCLSMLVFQRRDFR